MAEQVLDLQTIQWTRRVKMIALDDVTGAIRAIVNDWGADILTANCTSAGLVLADLVYYAGIDAVEALGAELTEELRKRGVL